jgi:cellulose synthase/poly-beta-1,6-N-acetylglucosamine synthase-like glycosyltransferase
MNRGFLSKWRHADVLSQRRMSALRNEIRVGYAAVGLALISIVAFLVHASVAGPGRYNVAGWPALTEFVIANSLLAFFLFSGLVYQLTRLGYLKRFSTHRAVPGSELECIYASRAPSLAILVPSYKEESNVVRQTLLAAALQQSPNRRIVLLIDDPPAPCNREDAARLARMWDLPREIDALFAPLSRKFRRALVDFEQQQHSRTLRPEQEVKRLAALLCEAAAWLYRLADETAVKDHTDALFVERILRAPARSHRARADALVSHPDPASVDLLLEYCRLAALFKFEATSFERKRYANLSHEPNKAMNLNSYLALMGSGFREIGSPRGLVLEQADAAQATVRIPNADFVVVLDADSLILPQYSLRLVHFMTRPENERVAVVQTPYASVPGAASMAERIAGATTDVQLMSHQGSMLFSAGSWVGASALVRRTALEDIVVTEEERGYPVRSYIRDRTLNEDTDTTVDLIRKH